MLAESSQLPNNFVTFLVQAYLFGSHIEYVYAATLPSEQLMQPWLGWDTA